MVLAMQYQENKILAVRFSPYQKITGPILHGLKKLSIIQEKVVILNSIKDYLSKTGF